MKYICLMLYFISSIVSAKNIDSSKWKAWIPSGWKLIHSSEGDLNKDGKSDVILVIEENNAAKRQENDSLSAPVLNFNPRNILVLFKTADGYKRVARIKGFLPRENDPESYCLEDPFGFKNLKISRGLFKIELNYWASCGGWGVSHETFTFRYEPIQRRFQLIGLDTSSSSRNIGDNTDVSINYLTGRKKTSTGINDFEETKPSDLKVLWENMPKQPRFYLDKMSSDCSNDGKTAQWCRYQYE
ncbi:hypothetical protein AwWohl_13780 [Gammaproteobacteria bacterium]|nr:hypothetical protein AwWohl_13780 [Gammaproteobacteria bacterium]